MNRTAQNQILSKSYASFGAITDLNTAAFELKSGDRSRGFFIKNENATDVTLEVMPLLGDAYVTVIFEPGWNTEECVKKIKIHATAANLLWGF